MPDPYGITQVDVPGVVNAVQASQQNRLQQLLLQQHINAAERAAERENQFNIALTRIRGVPSSGKGAGAAVSAYGGTPAAALPAPTTPVSPASVAPVTAATAVGNYGTPPAPAPVPAPPAPAPAAAAAAPAPAATPPPDPSLRLDPQVAAQLVAIDPERGAQIVTQLRTLDNDRIAQLNAANNYLARFGQYLLHSNIPEAQWQAEIQRRTPDLLAHGVDAQQIQSFQANRQNVEYVVNQAQDIDKLIEHARPDLMVAPQGSTIINRDAVGQTGPDGRPVNPVVYESPVVTGPNGEPFARPPSMSQAPNATPPQPGEVRQTSRGPMRFRGGDYRNPANYDPVQGGAPPPNAAGTFPRQDGGAFDFNVRPAGR